MPSFNVMSSMKAIEAAPGGGVLVPVEPPAEDACRADMLVPFDLDEEEDDGDPEPNAVLVQDSKEKDANGYYLLAGSHGGRRIFRKIQRAKVSDTVPNYLYFWDGEGDPNSAGWYIASHPDEDDDEYTEKWDSQEDIPVSGKSDSGGGMSVVALDDKGLLAAIADLQERIRKEVRELFADAKKSRKLGTKERRLLGLGRPGRRKRGTGLLALPMYPGQGSAQGAPSSAQVSGDAVRASLVQSKPKTMKEILAAGHAAVAGKSGSKVPDQKALPSAEELLAILDAEQDEEEAEDAKAGRLPVVSATRVSCFLPESRPVHEPEPLQEDEEDEVIDVEGLDQVLQRLDDDEQAPPPPDKEPEQEVEQEPDERQARDLRLREACQGHAETSQWSFLRIRAAMPESSTEMRERFEDTFETNKCGSLYQYESIPLAPRPKPKPCSLTVKDPMKLMKDFVISSKPVAEEEQEDSESQFASRMDAMRSIATGPRRRPPAARPAPAAAPAAPATICFMPAAASFSSAADWGIAPATFAPDP
eukprot:gnl/TRDRNA2_/TRDRNA2_172807_c1_seq2.p1 gnl/TRDRNA2_/TRDRNA2_172807_c1~~gnl/TRDRNA2_/TRDRNA2_172807_c1_seq2.p1  ORF type:complete len:532 (+),score=135.62 gnl/TRDRNA2_/TRDRNA2_172807_c1_seq2:177-1772(+)